ncbi:hypothetical protein [Alloscardovia macacae]|nr:hypothetical protein [Alloscardovia macacae]
MESTFVGGAPQNNEGSTAPPMASERVARPAVDVKKVWESAAFQKNLRSAGMSAGIGIGAALAVTLITVIVLMSQVATLSQSSNPVNRLVNASGISSVFSYASGMSSQTVFLVVFGFIFTAGISGSYAASAGGSVFGQNLGMQVNILFPLSLVGIALVVGCAYGAYKYARKNVETMKWGRLLNIGLSALISGVVYVLITVCTGTSVSAYSASVTLSGATFRTFMMAVFTAALGASLGHLLAIMYSSEKKPDLTGVTAKLGGSLSFVRTVLEFALAAGAYALLLSGVGIIVMATQIGLGVSFVAFLLVWPVLASAVFALSTGGSLTASGLGVASGNLTAFNGPWWMWLMVLGMVILTLALAYRLALRHTLNEEERAWSQVWKAPVAGGIIWIIVLALYMHIEVTIPMMSGVSAGVELWHVLLVMLWIFAIEVLARVVIPAVVDPAQRAHVEQGVKESLHKATTMSKKTKLIIILTCVLLVLIAAGAGAVRILNDTVFSPRVVAEKYLAAISAGHYDEASAIADPQVDKDKRVLLTDAAAKGENTTISHVQIKEVFFENSDTADIRYAFNIDGQTYESDLHLMSEGNKYLFFKNWILSVPELKELSITSSVKSGITVNGVPVSQKNSTTPDGELRLKVYPGKYTIDFAETKYLEAKPVTEIAAQIDARGQVLEVKTKSTVLEEINKAIHEKLDSCAQSTAVAPEGCPFRLYTYFGSEEDYRNISWSIVDYPEITLNSNGPSGTFSRDYTSAYAEAKVTYERKLFTDDWVSGEDSRYINVSGSYAIDGDKLTIKFDDSN